MTRSRRFMDYEEPDGKITNRRWMFLIVSTVGMAVFFAAIPLALGQSALVVALTALIFGACGAAGSLIAFAIDWKSRI